MHESPIIKVAGLNLDLAVILMLLVTCTVVFVLARLAVRNLSVENPSKLQNFMEWAIEFIQNMISSTMDMKKGKSFVSLGLTLIMFIFAANLLGLPFSIVTEHEHPSKVFGFQIESTAPAEFAELVNEGEKPEVSVVWWKSPTADVSVSMGLAFMIFSLVHFLGLAKNTKGYLKHYLQPYPVFLPINIIEQFSKLLTHGMRLYGNIFAGEVLLTTLISAGLVGILPMIIWQGFSIFVGAMQAFVFTILTMVYISQVLETHDEH